MEGSVLKDNSWFSFKFHHSDLTADHTRVQSFIRGRKEGKASRIERHHGMQLCSLLTAPLSTGTDIVLQGLGSYDVQKGSVCS